MPAFPFAVIHLREAAGILQRAIAGGIHVVSVLGCVR
jgi:hypothetical protein